MAVSQTPPRVGSLRSPLSPLLSPFRRNNDDEERARMRALQAKAKRKSLLPSSGPGGGGDNPNESEGYSADRLKTMFDSCVKLAAENGPRKTYRDYAALEAMSDHCIRLAAENKITAKNTWDLHLIDHISDIVKESNEENEQTNFQKASCTLEAGVKIYAYRVDSVHTETYKVLGGLNRTTVASADEDPGGEDGEEGRGEDGEEGGEGTERKKQKKVTASSATMEASWEPITLKKFDSAFAIDPLFHQTSAQFDAGGARGMLLHNLSVYRRCEIVFDSEDVPDAAVGREGEEGEEEEEASFIDLSFMQDQIEGFLDVLKEEPEISPSIERILCQLNDPRRKAAEMEAAAGRKLSEAPPATGEDPCSGGVGGGGEGTSGGGEDFNGVVDDDFEGAGGGMDDECDYGGGAEGGVDEGFGVGGADSRQIFEGAVGGAPMDEAGRDAEDSQVASTDWLKRSAWGEEEGEVWEGAKYWKFRRPKDDPNKDTEDAEPDAEPKKRKPRKKKEVALIDFSDVTPADRSRLKAPRNPNTLLRTKAMKVADPKSILLPPDAGYDRERLLYFFLRPNQRWDMPGGRSRTAAAPSGASGPAPYGDGGVDEGGTWEEGGGGDDDDGWGGDDSGGGGVGNDLGDVDNELEGMVAEPRKVEQIRVSYARTSKQVDVRQLKETLWHQITEEQTGQDESVDSSANPSEGLSFKKLLRNFPRSCAAAPIEDISVHLCFICVLHLANEHNLAIVGCEEMNELQVINVREGEGSGE